MKFFNYTETAADRVVAEFTHANNPEEYLAIAKAGIAESNNNLDENLGLLSRCVNRDGYILKAPSDASMAMYNGFLVSSRILQLVDDTRIIHRVGTFLDGRLEAAGINQLTHTQDTIGRLAADVMQNGIAAARTYIVDKSLGTVAQEIMCRLPDITSQAPWHVLAGMGYVLHVAGVQWEKLREDDMSGMRIAADYIATIGEFTIPDDWLT